MRLDMYAAALLMGLAGYADYWAVGRGFVATLGDDSEL